MKRISKTGVINGDKLLSALNRDLDDKHKLKWFELEYWVAEQLSCHDAKHEISYYNTSDDLVAYVETHDIELNRFHTKSRNPEHVYDICYTQFKNGKGVYSYGNYDIMVEKLRKDME